MSTTQTNTIRFNIRADINENLHNQQNLVFRERHNNQSTKTSNSKQVEGEVWQLGYKPVEMTTKNKNRDMIAKFDDTLVSVLLFY